MRPALQRLLGSPSTLTILRHAIDSPQRCPACWSCGTVQSKTARREYSSGSKEASAQRIEKLSTAVSFRKVVTVGLQGSNNATRQRLEKTVSVRRRNEPRTSNERYGEGSRLSSDVQEQQEQAGTRETRKNNAISKTPSGRKLESTSLSNAADAVHDGNSSKRNPYRRVLRARKPSRSPQSKPSTQEIQASPFDDSSRNIIDSEPQLPSDLVESLYVEEQARDPDRRTFHRKWVKHLVTTHESWRNFLDLESQQSPVLLEMLYLEELQSGNLDRKHSAREVLLHNDHFLPSLRKHKACNDPRGNRQSLGRQESSVPGELASLKENYRVLEDRYRWMKEHIQVLEEKDRESKERDKAFEEREQASKERYGASKRKNQAFEERIQVLEEKDRKSKRRDKVSEERDRASKERYEASERKNQALEEHIQALKEKNRESKERDEASEEGARASKERYQASERREQALLLRCRALEERLHLLEERDRASKERYKAAEEKNQALVKRLQATGGKVQSLKERGQASKERYRALEERHYALEKRYTARARTLDELGSSSSLRIPVKVNRELETRLESSSQGMKPKNDAKSKTRTGVLPNGLQFICREIHYTPADRVIGSLTAASGSEEKDVTLTAKRRLNCDLREQQQPESLVVWKVRASDSISTEQPKPDNDGAWLETISSDERSNLRIAPSSSDRETESCLRNTDAVSPIRWKGCTPAALASTLTDHDPKTYLVGYPEVQKHLGVPGLHHTSRPSEYSDGWRNRLTTIEQYEYESNVHLPASRGPRLVDNDQYASDFELWLELVLFRRRRYNVYALQPLWDQIQARNLELPTEGNTANLLWKNFVDMGLRCRAMLPTVVQYAIVLLHRTNRYWKDLYKSVIHFQLMYSDHSAYKSNFRYYHSQLYERFPPTVGDFLSLFDSVHAREQSSKFKLLALRRIYADLPFRDLYAIIMERLYKVENFEAAASWHNVMVTRQDIPTDLQTYRPLFRYMVLYGDRHLLATMVDNMVRAKIQLPSFIRHPLPISPVSQGLIDQRLAEIHSITPNAISDEFCARMFATAWFSIDTVIRMFRAIGLDTLGPLALREIAIREKSVPAAVSSRVRQLQASGIRLDSSTYCSLVSRLALEDNARLLENVIECDLHPETFQDRALQESLLSTYYDNGDQLQIDRTLAILMTDYPEIAMPKAHWNIQLRLRLKQKDMHAVNRILGAMYASEIPVEPMSCNYVRVCLLTRRAPGKRPHHNYDLPVIINIWKHVLRSGGTVPPISWIEILRRLGMTGQLEEYENLALWLAKYYSGSTDDAALEKFPRTQELSKHTMRRLVIVPSRLSPMRREHPLQILFPPSVHQAVVAWGFQHAHIGGTNWRWGLHLLLKLKQFNVHVERETVARACRLRLGILFGTRQSSKPVNRRSKASNTAPLEYYLREIEKIAGRSLFLGRDYPPDDEERIKLLLEQFPTWDKCPRGPEPPTTTPVLLDISHD